ncbi:hypothetical protein VTJ49DRAFT_6803 [Mycothermus thermophilus]|uniref:SUZ domain-containing protein n=1 Tax=Humicola insolens TaxID=85995 RepID=A0ABR3VIQ0_HUMIN
MPKDNFVPDAWDDDDWEAKADLAAKQRSKAPAQPQPEPPMTRAERLAKHAEEQRKLWESADSLDEAPFLPPSTNPIPFSTAFKPPVKVLSRKPTPQVIAKRDPTTGLEQLTLEDEKEEDGANQAKKQETAEDIRKRLEEKQRRYEEARAKIFGDSNPSSGQSTPRTGTPPTGGSEGRQSHRGRGRGRGRGGRDQDNGRQERRSQGNQQQQQPGGTRELFDPNYSPKPGFHLQKRGDRAAQPGGRGNAPREEDQVIRAPRGPDGTGRGFGFARRGGAQG